MPTWSTCGTGCGAPGTPMLDGAGWEPGTELAYLQELVAYWCDEFDWRVQKPASTRSTSSLTRSTVSAST